MSEVIYDLGDIGVFQDVVEWHASEGEELGWFLDVVMPWRNDSLFEGIHNMDEQDSLRWAGQWMDRFVYEKRSGIPTIYRDVGFFSLPLRPELFVFNGLHASRITETFDGKAHHSIQETVTIDSPHTFLMRVQVLTHAFHGDFAFGEFPVVYFPSLFDPICASNVFYGTRYTLDLIATPYRTLPPINYPVNPVTGETIYAIGVNALSIGAMSEGASVDVDFSNTVDRYPRELLPSWFLQE